MNPAIRLIVTNDGSHSLLHEALDETYHSHHGALQESQYVYITQGLAHWCSRHTEAPRVLEIGFGTGLNAFLSLIYAENTSRHVYYESLETFPLGQEHYENLNYVSAVGEPGFSHYFDRLHEAEWGKEVSFGTKFTLKKVNCSVHHYASPILFNIVYFDAFAPRKHPGIWTTEVMERMHGLLTPDGILVTYSAKGQVKRNLMQAGFTVERLKGPPGKKEMVGL